MAGAHTGAGSDKPPLLRKNRSATFHASCGGQHLDVRTGTTSATAAGWARCGTARRSRSTGRAPARCARSGPRPPARQHRGQHDADDGHAQRVEHADPEGLPVARRLVGIMSRRCRSRRAGPGSRSRSGCPAPACSLGVVRQEPDRPGDEPAPAPGRAAAHGAAAPATIHAFLSGRGEALGWWRMAIDVSQGGGRGCRTPHGSRPAAAACGRRSVGGRGCGSAHRRGVHEAALVPQVVAAARQADRRLRADVALEDLAVVAHGLDGAVGPFLVQAQQLAGVLGAVPSRRITPGRCCRASSGRRWPA
jgi:hypothetical protein